MRYRPFMMSTSPPFRSISISRRVLFFCIILPAMPIVACPFCAKLTRSYSDEVRDSDGVVFGVLSKETRTADQTRLAVSIVVRSHPAISSHQTITLDQSVPAADREPITRLVFLRRDQESWKAHRIDKSSPAFAEYLAEVWKLFDEPAATRMAFFFRRLNDPDPKVAADGFAEFAKASFRTTEAAARTYDPVRIREWLQDPTTPEERIGLFGLLLGLSGEKSDVEFLDRLIMHPSLTQRNGLDGLMGGLLIIDRDRGVQRIVQLLTSTSATSLERMSAVSALRFLLADIPPEDPKPILRQVTSAIRDPELSGQLIDEFRKGECWEVLPDVLGLFASSREPSAIIRFAIACPSPDANRFVSELREKNPALVQDAEQTLSFEQSARELQQPSGFRNKQ